MSKVVLGTAEGKAVHLDLDVLLTTRLLVTADSGGGKTVLLKRLCEQIFGKIPIHIIDPEGEFSPLREKFGFVLVGQGGETPADPRSAELVAQTLLKERASVVCDLYEMKPSMRHEFVKNYCDALIDAPKSLWHPTIVIVDEAHLFCPEGKAGESLATDSVKALSTRGRKRGICPIFATQRLAEFNKGASSMCLNRLVGGTFEDVNQKRALDVLSVASEEKAAVLKELKLLPPGDFYALGRAICKERTLIHVGTIETPHGQTAQKYASVPPPAPEAIAKLLPKLSDLPKAAEEKARTEREYKTEIQRLKMELKKATQNIPVSIPKQDTGRVVEREISKAVALALDGAEIAIRKRDQIIKLLRGNVGQISAVMQKIAAINDDPPYARKQVSGGKSNTGAGHDKIAGVKPLERAQQPYVAPSRPITVRELTGGNPSLRDWSTDVDATLARNGALSGAQRRILDAMAIIASFGEESPTKAQVASWAGYAANGGGFANAVSSLRTSGYLEYVNGGSIRLTDAVPASASDPIGFDQEALWKQVERVLSNAEQKILKAIMDAGKGNSISKADVAAATGYEVNGGGFSNYVSSLKTKMLITYPASGKVQAADWLFID